jgi:peptidoglycan hydrolase CwlO-like protein
MKQLNLILVFVVAMLAVCGRCAPALAQDASAAGTLDFQAPDVAASNKACNPTSTSAKCLLTAITTLQAQVTTLQGQVTTLTSQVSSLQTTLTAVQNNHALALGRFVSVDSSAENGLKGPNITFSGANVHIVSGSTPAGWGTW